MDAPVHAMVIYFRKRESWLSQAFMMANIFTFSSSFLSKSWAEKIRKIFEVDPMVCQCGGMMKIIAF
jgi:hypothetical protein